MKLIINNSEIDLKDVTIITQTKQVNDIARLDNRQSNLTNQFSAPKTAKNIRTFELLGIVGNQSNIPYQKNECYLLSDSGEAFIHKGWAVVTETAKEYKIHIYDGIIDFFKLIENKTLGNDLILTEINHDKTVATVINSFTAGLNYRYLLADYNGKTHFGVNTINIDFLPPSAKVSYLWNKIFTTFGATYSSSYFNTPAFQDLWLTYPKGVVDSVIAPVEIYDRITGFVNNAGITYNGNSFDVQVSQFITVEIASGVNNPFFQYIVRFYLNGILTPIQTFQANAGDNFYTTIQFINPTQPEEPAPNGVVKIFRLGSQISFSEELKEFRITDFFKEIVIRGGLTIFKSKYQNHYTFKTLEEITDRNNAIDYSDKFVSVDSEKYIYGNYAKRNNFKLKYNDEFDNYNDGFLTINNVNLPDTTNTFVSQTFAPLKDLTNFSIGANSFQSKVFKQYDKEIKENNTGAVQEIKYKPLSKRYYFQSSDQSNETADFGSEKLLTTQNYNGVVQKANFNQLDMASIVGLNYPSMTKLLNKSKILSVNLWLNDNDVTDFDFSVPYYIKQLGDYFIMNKINNFITGKITKCELIRINY
jgi:hypothetical protein